MEEVELKFLGQNASLNLLVCVTFNPQTLITSYD